MATWSDVELLTNEDTNTVRFGSVSRDENGSGLYQVDTLVKISTANEVINYTIFRRKPSCMSSTSFTTQTSLGAWRRILGPLKGLI